MSEITVADASRHENSNVLVDVASPQAGTKPTALNVSWDVVVTCRVTAPVMEMRGTGALATDTVMDAVPVAPRNVVACSVN